MIEIFAGMNSWLVGIIAAVVAIIGTWAAGRRAGAKGEADAAALRHAERDQQQAAAIRQAVQERRDVDNTVARLPDGGAADRLRDQWSRD